jgi:RimJ/RimL family protein N-acetyltransferase
MLLSAYKISAEDLPARVAWINDPRVNDLMYFRLPVSLESTTRWFEKVRRNYDRHDLVFKNEGGVPVGMSGITAINSTFRNGEFYIFINPDMQGLGAGKAITAWMLEYGFQTLGLNKIYLYVDGDNHSAVGLYLKLGFVKEGHLREHRFKNGKFHDKLVYGILKKDWLTQNRPAQTEANCPVITNTSLQRTA